MNNIQNFIYKIKNKKGPIIWHQDRYYDSEELLNKIKKWKIIIKKKKIKPSELIAFQENYSIDSISFFLSALIEKLIVVNLPPKQKNLIKLVNCKYFVDIKKFKILKKKIKSSQESIILNKFRKKKVSGLIIFSSGSSGKPKAILHNFSSLLNKFKKKRQGYRTLLMLTFDHIGGINTLLSCILNPEGLAICVNKKSAVYVCKIIEKTKATLLPTSPTFLNMLMFSGIYKIYDFSSIKLITYGTEPMPENLLSKLHKTFPNIFFKQTYGLSEIGIMRTKDKKNGSLYVKVGGEDYKTKIINDYLYVKSKANMVGYINAPQPFDKDGWMNTGDKVIKEKNGFIKILGRDSDMINIGGEKTYPLEVENILLKFQNVLDARVYSNYHEILGNYMVADIILKKNYDNKKFNTSLLRNYCSKYLPKHKIPSKFIIKNFNEIVSNRFKKIRKNNQNNEKNNSN